MVTGIHGLYAKFQKFSSILERETFDYVASKKRFYNVFEAIQSINDPSQDGRFTNGKSNIFDTFRSCLGECYDDVTGSQKRVPHTFKNGIRESRQVLKELSTIRDESDEKRRKIGGGVRKRFKRELYDALQDFVNGLEALFDPDFINSNTLQKEEIKQFLIDRDVGWGDDFVFNNGDGDYAFLKRITDENFSKSYIQSAMNALRNYDVREQYAFTVLGNGKVRVHINGNKVFRVYRADADGEHEDHRQDMTTSVDQFEFRPA